MVVVLGRATARWRALCRRAALDIKADDILTSCWDTEEIGCCSLKQSMANKASPSRRYSRSGEVIRRNHQWAVALKL